VDNYFFWGIGKPFSEGTDPYGDWIDVMEEMFDYYDNIIHDYYFYTTV
jgi:hypothetical protein